MTNIGDNTIAGDRLKSFIERIERLEEDKQGIAADIRELKAEARAEGFDQKMINEMLRLRKMHAPAREEFEAMRDTYMHALGMLADTPLGEAARRRFDETPKDNKTQPPQTGPAAPPAPQQAKPPNVTIQKAGDLGEKAAKDGKPVTDNPFPATDKRRAAWDVAWCRAAGNDGMEIPDAWRRKSPETPDKPEKTQKGADA